MSRTPAMRLFRNVDHPSKAGTLHRTKYCSAGMRPPKARVVWLTQAQYNAAADAAFRRATGETLLPGEYALCKCVTMRPFGGFRNHRDEGALALTDQKR